MSEKDAIAVIRARVSSIPADLKALFAVLDDPELADDLRGLAASAIFYNLNPSNLLPHNAGGVLGFADDVLAIRCALDEVRTRSPERARKHAEAAPESWEGLEGEIAVLSALLGDLWAPFCEAWRTIGAQEWRGHRAQHCVSDADESTWLYEAVEEEMSNRDIDEQAVVREIQKAPLLAKLSARLATRKRA